jgi:hypothetical protein
MITFTPELKVQIGRIVGLDSSEAKVQKQARTVDANYEYEIPDDEYEEPFSIPLTTLYSGQYKLVPSHLTS